jgi:hypothetical protein
MVIPEGVVRTKLDIYQMVDTSASGVLVIEGITRPVVSTLVIEGITRPVVRTLVIEGITHPVVRTLALTWFIRYICYCNLQFLNNVIINKTKVLLPQV